MEVHAIPVNKMQMELFLRIYWGDLRSFDDNRDFKCRDDFDSATTFPQVSMPLLSTRFSRANQVKRQAGFLTSATFGFFCTGLFSDDYFSKLMIRLKYTLIAS